MISQAKIAEYERDNASSATTAPPTWPESDHSTTDDTATASLATPRLQEFHVSTTKDETGSQPRSQ